MQQLIDRLITRALRGRYLTVGVAVAFAIAGLVAWKSLPLEAYPELANPQVRVITLMPGKGAEEVERLVTVPLEKEINGVPGQTALRSLSLYGLSVIISTFKDGTPTTVARQQVLERIHEADIPPEAQPHLEPDVGSLREIYRYSLHSTHYSAMGLRAVQQWELEKLFRQVPGVIGMISEGGPTKTYQVTVDPYKLRQFDISLKELYDAVARSNGTTGGGFIEHNGNALIVRQLGLIHDQADLRDVAIKSTPSGIPVKVGDVATIDICPMVRRGQVGCNEEDDVVEGIVLLRRGENPSRVLDELKLRLPSILKRLPATIEFTPLYDRTKLTDLTLKTVGTNVAVGISLVVLFLSIFLVDIGSAVVTAVTIPLAMLTAFICLCFFGVPANLLSLGAIDFGILVDSAVVMTENIVRRLSKDGRSLNQQKRLLLLGEAAREVGSPIVFGIIVIIATFLPIFTFAGVEGKLFRPLATTMVCALIGAGVAALALVPVLCSFFLLKSNTVERESPLIELARRFYKPSLGWALNHPKLVLTAAALAVVGSGILFTRLGSEFLPHLEEGNIWLRATIKPGSVTLDESVKVAREIRQTLLTYPEVTRVLSQVGGPDDGTDPARFADQEYFIDLEPAKRWRSRYHERKDLLVSDLRADLGKIPGVDYYFTQYIQTTLDEALSGVQGSLVAKVSGTDLQTLESLGHKVGTLLTQTPGIVDVIVDPLLGQPQLAIEIDRDKAARYGLNVSDLQDLVEIAIGGKECTRVIDGERRFSVIVRLDPKYRSSEQSLEHILLDTPDHGKVPLSDVATIKEIVGATQIWRDSGSRMATIRANVHGRDLATAVNEAQAKVASQVQLPDGYAVTWSGEFERQREATRQLAIVLPITLIVIISILYLSCGSLRGAIIMFSVVPLAAIGAVLALALTGTYFSIAAGVGLIALFGLAVKNGILLVSFVNELRSNNQSVYDSVYNGSLTRMRPVLMTAVIAAVGLLPAALSNEIGSQTQKPFAIVIIGGLVSCTLLTLYVLPVLYLLFTPNLPRTRPSRSRSTKMKVIAKVLERSSMATTVSEAQVENIEGSNP